MTSSADISHIDKLGKQIKELREQLRKWRKDYESFSREMHDENTRLHGALMAIRSLAQKTQRSTSRGNPVVSAIDQILKIARKGLRDE